MSSTNIQIEPGEITIVLADDINILTQHACHTAGQLADMKVPVQLFNAGMMSRRFWKIAREAAPNHITDRYGSRFLQLRTAHRGNLYGERGSIRSLHDELKTKVLIVSGWEWASKSWRYKEDLIFYLRELAEETGMAIIVYSQARTNPVPGCIDRGGVGKLASIALSIVRIAEDENEVQKPVEPVIISPQDEVEAERFAQLVSNKINDLDSVRAGEDELAPEEVEEVLEYA